MKKFLLLLPLLFALTLSAQEMPSVAGVTFGWTRAECKRVLDNRFNGGESSYQSTPNELTYYDVRFGGFYFNYVEFIFQSDGNRTYLSTIRFLSSFDVNESKRATQVRDDVYETYSKKYEFRWSDTNDDGFKYYVLGHDPNKWADGFVVISTEKSRTRGGDMKIWTKVYYGTSFIKAEDEI